jgi:hypothetical protein
MLMKTFEVREEFGQERRTVVAERVVSIQGGRRGGGCHIHLDDGTALAAMDSRERVQDLLEACLAEPPVVNVVVNGAAEIDAEGLMRAIRANLRSYGIDVR